MGKRTTKESKMHINFSRLLYRRISNVNEPVPFSIPSNDPLNGEKGYVVTVNFVRGDNKYRTVRYNADGLTLETLFELDATALRVANAYRDKVWQRKENQSRPFITRRRA